MQQNWTFCNQLISEANCQGVCRVLLMMTNFWGLYYISLFAPFEFMETGRLGKKCKHCLEAPLVCECEAYGSTSHYISVSGSFLLSHILHVDCNHILDKFIKNASSINCRIFISFWTLARTSTLLSAISSCTDKLSLLLVGSAFAFAQLFFIGKCLHTGFHQIRNLTCRNMCLGIKKPRSMIPKGAFHTFMFFPKQVVEAFKLQERQGNTSGPDQSILLESALSGSISQRW